MIPSVSEDFLEDFDEITQPSKDYNLDTANRRICGSVEDLEAVRQAIYIILNTERYTYLIYSWDYGVELSDLIGQPYTYVVPELERRVSECLTQDDRIISVTDFAAEKKGNAVHATFTVNTIYGDIESEVVVNV